MSLRKLFFVIYVFSFSLGAMAQSDRKMTRKGNTQYESGNFVDAEIQYKKALNKNGDLLEAQFNLGDALAKQERYEEALASFDMVSELTEDPSLKANALYNKGNVLLSQQDLEGALESFKSSLRIDPKDEQARYNYAFVKRQLEQQQQQDQEQEQNQDQQNEGDKEDNNEDPSSDSQDNNDPQEDSDNKDQEGSDKDEGESDDKEQNDKGQTDGDDADDEKEGPSPKPSENKLSPEEAQRLLEALSQQEDQVQEKMKRHKLKGAQVKIEKDW
jgi:tetratricopeptide (TPR) repeat protein